MSGGALSAILQRMKFWLISVVALLCCFTGPGAAQSPTIIDFWTKSDTLFLEISMNAEALMAGIDPATSSDFSESRKYRELRALVSSELEPQIKAFVKPWVQRLQVVTDGPVTLSYEGVRIPVVGDPKTVRISRLLLAGPLPDGASNLRLAWPEGSGPVVIRQQRVAAPYTGYLTAGQTSPLIPLMGGGALSAEQTLQAFFPKGAIQILRSDPRQILLVLTLVFLSLNLRPLMMQLLVFSIATLIGLVSGLYGVIQASQMTVSQALLAAIVLLALWNLFLRRVLVLRLLAVFAVGLVQGLTLAFALADIGIPPNQMPPAILGFGTGALLALWAVAWATFFLAVLISGRSLRLRGRISVLASMMIAGVAAYWIAQPLIFS